jgi:hypothetical protein
MRALEGQDDIGRQPLSGSGKPVIVTQRRHGGRRGSSVQSDKFPAIAGDPAQGVDGREPWRCRVLDHASIVSLQSHYRAFSTLAGVQFGADDRLQLS